MERVILINKYQNPKGRVLVQDGRFMYVLSSCCDATLKEYNPAICTNCGEPDKTAPAGWTHSADLPSVVLGVGTGVVAGIWSEWLTAWFGLEGEVTFHA